MSPRQKLNEKIAEKLEEMHTESPDKGYRRLRMIWKYTIISLSTTKEYCVSAVKRGLNQPLNTATMAVPDRRVILSI